MERPASPERVTRREVSVAADIQITDQKARVTLPKAFVSCIVVVEQIGEREVRIRKAEIIPRDELPFQEESVTASEYTIAIKMLPVRSFDSATNAQLNREKARALALRALARHLSEKSDVYLLVSGSQVTRVATEGNVFALTLYVPRHGVAIGPIEGKERESDKPRVAEFAARLRTVTSLLIRKQDYLDTLEHLQTEWDRALKEGKRAPPSANRDLAFYTLIAELEERGQRNLTTLSADIIADSLLLQIEKGQLIHSVNVHKERMLASLKEVVLDFELATHKKKP